MSSTMGSDLFITLKTTVTEYALASRSAETITSIRLALGS
jgi:hypothetical protein